MPSLKMRMAIPSRQLLRNLSIWGAIASISAAVYMHWRLQDNVRQAEYYKLAIQSLRQHRGAVGLLGEPIKETGFSLWNVKNICDKDKAQFQVSVRGTKDKGVVYFWATHNAGKGWLIDRLELETKQHPHKRFLLKKPIEREGISQQRIEVPAPTPIVAHEAKPNLQEEVQEQMQEQMQEQIEEQMQAYESPAEAEIQQTEENNATEGYQQQQPNYAQQLHQQQGQEPAPYIQTAEGGSMR